MKRRNANVIRHLPVRLLTVVLLLAAGAAPAAADVIRLQLTGLEAAALPPSIATSLPGLLAAALESGKGYQLSLEAPAVPGAGDAAGWDLRLDVSGKGPWKLSARAVPAAGSGARGKAVTGRVSLSTMEDLPAAVDRLAADLHLRLSELDPRGRRAGAPVPVAMALTSSPPALLDWLEGSAAIRRGEAPAARKAFERALGSDPGFVVARADLHYLLASIGEAEPMPAAGASSGSPDPARGPLAGDLARGLDFLERGENARAFQVGELLTRELPSLRWGRVLRGLALARLERTHEAADDWALVASADPGDPRGWRWVGLSALAAGQLAEASRALRRCREAWPERLDTWALEAEALARGRDVAGAKTVLEAMQARMREQKTAPSSDRLNPRFMLGSLALLEGRFGDSLARYEEALEEAEQAGGAIPTDGIHRAIIELKREAILNPDPVARSREIGATRQALDDYAGSLTPEAREKSPWIVPWLRGLIEVRAGDTIAGWRTVEEIRAMSEKPGYSPYWEAYLTGATLLKEEDMRGAVPHFQRAAEASDGLFDWIIVGQLRSKEKEYDEARRIFQRVEERLRRLDAASPKAEWVLASPRLAASIPIYHYRWAVVGFLTGNVQESRTQYGRMLRYYSRPDEELRGIVVEALDRGARPE